MATKSPTYKSPFKMAKVPVRFPDGRVTELDEKTAKSDEVRNMGGKIEGGELPPYTRKFQEIAPLKEEEAEDTEEVNEEEGEEEEATEGSAKKKPGRKPGTKNKKN